MLLSPPWGASVSWDVPRSPHKYRGGTEQTSHPPFVPFVTFVVKKLLLNSND
jgi:hypothetical protein